MNYALITKDSIKCLGLCGMIDRSLFYWTEADMNPFDIKIAITEVFPRVCLLMLTGFERNKT